MKKSNEEQLDYLSTGFHKSIDKLLFAQTEFRFTYYRSEPWQKQYSADNQSNDHCLLIG